jgi:thioredoxin reductase (NADPH)
MLKYRGVFGRHTMSDGSDDTDSQSYEVAVVGGGPAGLTAALYATRLGHDSAVIDRGGGRAAMMQETHNVIGVPEEQSGNEFLATAREQVVGYGADHHRDYVDHATTTEDGRFCLHGNDVTVYADRVVLATGFADGRPSPPAPRTGRGLHYCLHCDAYMFVDVPVYVMGTTDAAAKVAMIMLNFTPEVDLLLDGEEPEWDDVTDEQLAAHPVEVLEPEVTGVENGGDGWLEAMEFADGTRREYRGGFAMYGSNYNTELAEQLGCELNDDGTIAVEDHGQTSVDGVYAVGDVVPGHNQVPVAMAQGAKAGISVHYDLRKFPVSVADLEAHGPITAEDVPGIGDRVRDAAQHHEGALVGEGKPADD